MGTLSADPLTGARELGTAAAKVTTEGELAGKLLAMLKRLDVPVLSTDGSKALVAAPLSTPPKEIFFWEPVIVGLAHATAQGDTHPMSVVLKRMYPDVDAATLKELDFSTLFAKLGAEVAAAKATTHDALLVTAIAEDLQQRSSPVRDPRIDPVGAALFAMWLSLDQPSSAPAAPIAPPIPSNIPGLPPGFKIPGLNNQVVPPAGPGGYLCSAFGGAVSGVSFGNSALGLATKLGSYIPGSTGTSFGAWNRIFGLPGKLAGKAVMALEVIVALGIMAFVDIDGEVKPKSVKYGDAAAQFKVQATSANPLTKKEMDAFINCLEAVSGVGAVFWEELRNIPPAGALTDAPVLWLNGSEIDPKHGKFKVDHDWRPSSGFVDNLKNAGREIASDNVRLSLTNKNGGAKAEFTPKPKQGPKFMTVVKSTNSDKRGLVS